MHVLLQQAHLSDNHPVVNTEYSDNVIFELMMEKQVRQKFEKALTEMSSGSIGLREIKIGRASCRERV